MNYTAKNHTFVVAVYRDSPFLEESLKSLKAQTVLGKIIISTSTPSPYIDELAKRYDISVVVNTGPGGNANDWNFGYAQANTPLVTIAHQDDVYDPKYLETFLSMISKKKKPMLFFTDYNELRNDVYIRTNKLLRVKRFLLFPLRFRILQGTRFAKWFCLAFGDAINCPSVGFVKENLPGKIFVQGFLSDADWEAWVKLIGRRGSFIYTRKELVAHRIHELSQTSVVLGDSIRVKEDFEIFCRMWPESIAKALTSFYAKSENNNKL